jgi:hypothetical protein
MLNRIATILHEELGNAEFEILATKGRSMTMEQAIVYALEETNSEQIARCA